ncbi:MAG: replicative DNA helicase [Planctomycetota bacterium]
MPDSDDAPGALPHDIKAEMGVLGSMLLSPDAIHLAREALDPESFYKMAHQEVFSAILDLDDQHNAVDLILLRDGLKQRDKLEKVGGVSYLQELMEAVPTSANVEYYIDIVREKAVRRHLIQAATSIQKSSYQDSMDVDDLLDEAESTMLSVRHKKDSGRVQDMSGVLHGILERLDELHQNPDQLGGISTGFTDLNRITNGLHDGEFVVIAARPSVGKTTFALNMLHNVCHVERRPAALYSLEMGAQQIASNLLCIHNRLDTQDFRRGTLNDTQWNDLEKSIDDLVDLPFYMDDTPALRIGELRARARRLHHQHGIELIVVDYLQLLRPGRSRDNRAVEVGEISAGLKALARELNIPVVSIAQLNRSSAKEGRKPRMSDLRESGAIEQDADVIMLLHRPEEPGDEEFGPETGGGQGMEGGPEGDGASPPAGMPGSYADLIVAKQRNGPTGVCPLVFWQRYLRFESRSTHGGM